MAVIRLVEENEASGMVRDPGARMNTSNVTEVVAVWVAMAVILFATWTVTFWLLGASLRAVEWLITSPF